ncbi:MAG: glycosyltransferase family 39 protein [Planctomycetota bacterium]
MRIPAFIVIILIAAGILRSLYCYDLPVSGDESVSLLQAAGKALEYSNHIPTQPTRIEELQSLMKYSSNYGLGNVMESMEKAGVHPPLYYTLLHYTLRFFGNESFVVRLPSILFSTFSILMLYLLCRRLFGVAEALFAAMTLAVAAYGVHYAHMIRPYPMMMFISITSTWLMLKIYQENMINFSNSTLWLYLLITVFGLYGIYHYVFAVFFQALFLMLAARKNKKQLMIIMSVFVIVGICYLPWISKFLTQLQFVKTGGLYFHGISNPVRPIRYLFEFNLTRAMPGQYAWYKIFLLGVFFAITVAGVRRCVSAAIGRYFTVAVAGSFMIIYLADLIMRTNTINVPKLLFFFAPVLVVYFSAGAVYLIKRFPHLGASLVCLIFVAICVNTALTIRDSKAEDDPLYLTEYRNVINSIAKQEQNGLELLLLNQSNLRYTLCFAHAIESGDTRMKVSKDLLDVVNNEGRLLAQYTRVFMAAPRVNKTLAPQKISDIRESMQQHNFIQIEPDDNKDLLETGRLLIFENSTDLKAIER